MKLQSYLTRRYMAVSAALALALVFILSLMHWLGMDDTTEYYMLYEGEVLTEHYAPGEPPLEFDPGIKEYYWGKASLPRTYLNLIEKNETPSNKASLFRLDDAYIYILPYVAQGAGEVFYVVHRFADDEFELSNAAKRYLAMAVVFLLFALMLIVIFVTNHRVSKALASFNHWLSQVGESPKALDEVATVPLPESVRFDELKAGGLALQQSLARQLALQQAEQQRVEREKHFLASLSHELRTPMSVIKAAADLIEKRNQLSEKGKKSFAILNRAVARMGSLTSSLLHLWRKQESKEPKVSLDLRALVDEAVRDCRAYCSEDLDFDIHIHQTQPFEAQASLLAIVLCNLIRNAAQYTRDNKVTISIQGTGVTLSNACQRSCQQNDQAKESAESYGLGLYLVESICQQQGWLLRVSESPIRFEVCVEFAGEKNLNLY